MKCKLAWITVAAVAFGFLAYLVPQALAIEEFEKIFVEKYVKADSKDTKDVAFKEVVDKAGCNICHMGNKNKPKGSNPYCKALGKLIKKSDKKNKEKIQAALEKVAKMKSIPNDPNSPTFGDLIDQGKLPAGTEKK